MIINCFWHGTPFSLLEKLTLKSFLNHGYTVKLWVYDHTNDIETPDGVIIEDANKVLPFDKLFVYKGNGDCRKGSLGGFSDLFRYYLLYKFEGAYVDMDCTCLRYYDFKEDYVIKPHKNSKTVANVLKAPVGCDFLKRCIELTEEHVNENNNSWILPVNIFNFVVEEFKYQKYIVPTEYFGSDDSELIYKTKQGNYINDKNVMPKYILHWCREASTGRWNYRELYDWNKPKPLSIYYNLIVKNKLLK